MKSAGWTAGAALSVLALAGLAPAAQARLADHRPLRRADRVAKDRAAEQRRLETEVEALKTEVQALEQRLDAQAQAQQQYLAQVAATQAQAQRAQDQAQAAQAQAQADAGRIETLPQEVKSQIVKLTPKPGWWGDTKLAGLVFADASWLRNSADGVEQPGSGTAVDIKRFYVTIDHRFNDVFSANMTTDFTYDSGPAAATQLYIKKAYLQARLSDALVIRLGSADMPWIPFVEGVYGYRYVENTLIDRTKFGTSADWGVHVGGDLAGGLFSYALSAVDGSGYKKPAIGVTNRAHSIDLEGRLSAHAAHFTAAIGGYTGKLGHDVVGGPPTFANAQRLDALIAYATDRFRLGGEYFWAKNWNDVTQLNPALRNTSDGWSGFGSVNLTRKFALFGRYDWVRPKKDTAPSLRDHYFDLGVSYEPVKLVDLALVYKRDSVDNGLFSTSNGVIGGVNSGTYDEVGLFTQFKF